MKNRWVCAWVFALLIGGFGISESGATEKPPLQVSAKQLNLYWRIAQEDMAPVMPPLVRATFGSIQKHGRIVLDYEVTINEKGVPVDFKFKSIQPTDVDPKPFIASVMFPRYRPTPQNGGRRPVRVHGPLPFFKPKE